MTRSILGFLAVFFLVVLASCGDDGVSNAGRGDNLVITVSDSNLAADGSTVDVTLMATTATGAVGTGEVTLTAKAGTFGNDGLESTLTFDEEGVATTTYACDVSEDSACVGKQTLTAKWNAIVKTKTVTLPGEDIVDGSMPSGMSGDYKITMAASRSTVYIGVEDTTDLTVTLTKAGKPAKNQTVTFETTSGNLTGTGSAAATITETTDSAGKIKVTLSGAETKGTTMVTAVHDSSEATAVVNIAVKELGAISYKSTTCSGANCTIMGKKGSGFNELALVSFVIKDAGGAAAVGVPVTFAFAGSPPMGTTVSAAGETDAKGVVSATVSSGSTIGTFQVVASVEFNEGNSATSPTIGVRAAKAANNGFTFSCNTVNLGAWVPINPPADVKTTCSFQLVDIVNNNVGTGTAVYFKAESGTIANSAPSTAFSASGNNINEGAGSVAYSTLGALPLDVPPLDADPNQVPYPRQAEPWVNDGVNVVRNPRDGLVTIIAYLKGEEYYNDINGNGTWDAGEQFYDMGEAFVDSNDNGVWDEDLNEILVDDVVPNGEWDGPNGVWDANTTIWVDTRVLVTGSPKYATVSPVPFAGSCGSGEYISGNAFVDISAWHPDRNLNRLPKGSSFTISDTSMKSATSIIENTYSGDGYGFDILRDLVSAADGNSPCLGAPICRWATRFGVKDGGGWSEGYSGRGRVKAPAANMTACQDDVATLKVSGVGGSTEANTTGGVK